MTAGRGIAHSERTPQEIKLSGSELFDNLCWSVQGDPTDGALVVAARKAGLKDETLDARFERVGEIPFSSSAS